MNRLQECLVRALRWWLDIPHPPPDPPPAPVVDPISADAMLTRAEQETVAAAAAYLAWVRDL